MHSEHSHCAFAPLREIFASVIILAVFMMTAAGCGRSGNTVRVSGQLLKDGKPYTANLAGKEPETFAIDFVGTVNGNSYVFPATITPTGAFKVDGAERRGIPPGEYKITVLHSGFLGAGGDRLNTRFAAEKTPLVVELTENAKLTIDLGAGTVTK
jgi:hypothetical protein